MTTSQRIARKWSGPEIQYLVWIEWCQY